MTFLNCTQKLVIIKDFTVLFVVNFVQKFILRINFFQTLIGRDLIYKHLYAEFCNAHKIYEIQQKKNVFHRHSKKSHVDYRWAETIMFKME